MIADTELQQCYIDLYKQVRNYIWDYSAACCLADLEIETFNRFPNISRVRYYLSQFMSHCNYILRDDTELMLAFNKFFNRLDDSDDTSYSKLYKVSEVIDT